MTTDTQISNVLDKVEGFRGVFLYDEIDKIAKLGNEFIVINYVTRSEAESGKMGHFCVLDNRYNVVKGDGWFGMFFFDSYGLAPDEPRTIMHLPNTHNIQRLINRSKSSYKINTKQWQVLNPHDDLCGIYSILYSKNPNFHTNRIFNTKESRVDLDPALIRHFHTIGLVKLV